MDKAQKTSVSLKRRHLDVATSRARAQHRGNISAYLQTLIERDESPDTNAWSGTILSDLARAYAGYLAPALSQQLADVAQPRVLHQLLAALEQYLHEGGDPMQLRIVDATTAAAGQQALMRERGLLGPDHTTHQVEKSYFQSNEDRPGGQTHE